MTYPFFDAIKLLVASGIFCSDAFIICYSYNVRSEFCSESLSMYFSHSILKKNSLRQYKYSIFRDYYDKIPGAILIHALVTVRFLVQYLYVQGLLWQFSWSYCDARIGSWNDYLYSICMSFGLPRKTRLLPFVSARLVVKW